MRQCGELAGEDTPAQEVRCLSSSRGCAGAHSRTCQGKGHAQNQGRCLGHHVACLRVMGVGAQQQIRPLLPGLSARLQGPCNHD